MKETEAYPSLRISHIVHGRQQNGHRVTYLVDPKGLGEDRDIPETVVLKRWRRRVYPGYRFSGDRLSSTVWRAVASAFGTQASDICSLTPGAIQERANSQRAIIQSQGFLKLPATETLAALFAICGPDRLQAIIDRHLSPSHRGKSGVPDLFLYASDLKTGQTGIARFVEVKKPEEPASAEQLDEIRFLQSLGLHARVLRLRERVPA